MPWLLVLCLVGVFSDRPEEPSVFALFQSHQFLCIQELHFNNSILPLQRYVKWDHLWKIIHFILKEKKKSQKTRIHSNNNCIKCWNKNYFCFHVGCRSPSLFLQRTSSIKIKLKSQVWFSFLKTGYAKTSHWAFSVLISLNCW